MSKIRRELSANFHRLNVLLIRIEEKNLPPVARKVAMATFSEAKIQANFGIKFFKPYQYLVVRLVKVVQHYSGSE